MQESKLPNFYIRLNSQQNAWVFSENLEPLGVLVYREPNESLSDWERECQREGYLRISFDQILAALPPTTERYVGTLEDWRFRDIAIRFSFSCPIWSNPSNSDNPA